MSKIFEKGYAVVIGAGADLPVTVKDAEAVAQLLQDITCCGYPKEQVRLLTEKSADRASILSALKWLAKVTQEADTVLVYFSGHGIETPDYYLMPYGYDLTNLSETAISGAIFTDCLRAIKAGKLVVVLDCCHAGGQAEAKGWVKSPLPVSVIEQLGGSNGRVILASSRKNEVSWTGNPYSVFTASVLEGFSGHGAFEEDGYARILDITLWAARKVAERTQDKQHPIIKVCNLADNFPVAWYAGGDKAPHALTVLTGSASVQAAPGCNIEVCRRMLKNYRENLMLIEERMSEFVSFTEIPLQLIKNKCQVEAKIREIEEKLKTGI